MTNKPLLCQGSHFCFILSVFSLLESCHHLPAAPAAAALAAAPWEPVAGAAMRCELHVTFTAQPERIPAGVKLVSLPRASQLSATAVLAVNPTRSVPEKPRGRRKGAMPLLRWCEIGAGSSLSRSGLTTAC